MNLPFLAIQFMVITTTTTKIFLVGFYLILPLANPQTSFHDKIHDVNFSDLEVYLSDIAHALEFHGQPGETKENTANCIHKVKSYVLLLWKK